MARGRNRQSDAQDEDDWETDGAWDDTPRASRRNRYDDEDEGYSPRRARGPRDYPRLSRSARRRSSGDDGQLAFILSLIGWFTCGILSIFAVVLGILAITDANRRGDSAPGLAIAAVVISGIYLCLLVGVIALYVLAN